LLLAFLTPQKSRVTVTKDRRFKGLRTMKVTKIAVLLLSSLVASVAQAETLECTMRPNSAAGGIVTEKYFFDYDASTGKAIGVDGWIQHYHDAPIPVRVSEDTAKKLVFSWNLTMSNNQRQPTKMQFRAAIFKNDNSITIRAVPGGGFSNDFTAKGTCQRAKG
jgi:hypothetical protein